MSRGFRWWVAEWKRLWSDWPGAEPSPKRLLFLIVVVSTVATIVMATGLGLAGRRDLALLAFWNSARVLGIMSLGVVGCVVLTMVVAEVAIRCIDAYIWWKLRRTPELTSPRLVEIQRQLENAPENQIEGLMEEFFQEFCRLYDVPEEFRSPKPPPTSSSESP